jgi:uncharacterized membrane protein YedE/YeeE
MPSTLLPLLGGVLIGTSASLLLWLYGRIAGVSGIVSGLLGAPRGDRAWRVAFLGGLWLGGLVLLAFAPSALPGTVPDRWPALVIAGALVGFGSGRANGCTSGHGVCGLGRRSRRSLVAVATFMATGALTTNLLRPLFGGVL